MRAALIAAGLWLALLPARSQEITISIPESEDVMVAAIPMRSPQPPGLAVLDRRSESVSLYYNMGSGFILRSEYPTLWGPAEVLVTRLEADSVFDVLVTSYNSPAITAAYGVANGSTPFTGDIAFDFRGRSSVGLLVEDIDRDGVKDLLLPQIRSEVQVYAPHNSSDPRIVSVNALFVDFVALSDLNADSWLDLVVWGRSGPDVITILEGDRYGDYTFAERFPALPSPGGLPLHMTAGDLDGDGVSEAILLAGSEDDSGNGFLYVVRGPPEYAVTRIPYEFTVGIPRVHVLDHDGDGKNDIVLCVKTVPEKFALRVLRSLGEGLFRADCLMELPGKPTSLEFADFTDDGTIDMAVAYPVEGKISVLPDAIACSSTSGCFTARSHGIGAAAADLSMGTLPGRVGAGIAIAGAAGGLLLHVDGSGVTEEPLAELGAGKHIVLVLDMEGDGLSELLAADDGGLTITRFPGESRRITEEKVLDLDARDLNGDARVDLVITSSAGVKVLEQMPSGDFEERSNLGSYAMAATGDFDGDGFVDICVLDPELSRVTAYRGSGALHFELETSSAVIRDTRALDVADLNGDGRDDVVTGSSSGNGVAVLLASPVGFQRKFLSLPEGSLITSLGVGDFGEGREEIAVATSGARRVVFAVLTPEERLEVVREVPLTIDALGSGSGATLSMATGHLDRNGVLDLAILTRETGHVDILLNRGCGGTSFLRRGDANNDSVVSITDAVHMVRAFFGGVTLECADAADTNDDEILGVTDIVVLLAYLFQGGEKPTFPGPDDCGADAGEGLGGCRAECF